MMGLFMGMPLVRVRTWRRDPSTAPVPVALNGSSKMIDYSEQEADWIATRKELVHTKNSIATAAALLLVLRRGLLAALLGLRGRGATGGLGTRLLHARHDGVDAQHQRRRLPREQWTGGKG